jgi:hypothetical protein
MEDEDVMFDGRGPKGGVGNLAGMTMASPLSLILQRSDVNDSSNV